MAYLASKLLIKALRTSGLVSADIGNQPSAPQMVSALFLLNEIISQLNINGALLPYTTTTDIDLVVGQEKYEIPALIELQVLTFYLDSIRFQLYNDGRADYFGSPRADNINSLPYKYHVERSPSGSTIWLYFKPSQEFPLQITGLFGYTPLIISTDISAMFDEFYRKFLRLQLAESICNYYNLSMPTGSAKDLMMIKDQLKYINVPDLSVQAENMLGGRSFLNYAQATFRNGFIPTS